MTGLISAEISTAAGSADPVGVVDLFTALAIGAGGVVVVAADVWAIIVVVAAVKRARGWHERRARGRGSGR
jgi:hypothetical protein